MATEDRKRVGVPISGIDIAAPDHSVTDGKCETIHNLRYANGAWRNVHPFEGKQNLQQTDYKIIYHHPATKDNEYIAEIHKPGSSALYAYFNFNDQYIYYLTDTNFKKGDAVYDDEKSLIGHIVSMRSQQYAEVIVQLLNGEEEEFILDRDDSFDVPAIEGSRSIFWVRVEPNGEVVQLQKITDLGEDSEVSVSHFGKVLIINDLTSKKLQYFILKGSIYKHIDWDVLDCSSTISVGTGYTSENLKVELVNAGDYEYPPHGFKGEGMIVYEKLCNTDFTEYYFEDFNEKDDMWRGEIAIFFAFRDKSGTILYKSSPQILRSSLLAKYNHTPDSVRILQESYDGDGYYALCGYKGQFEHPEVLKKSYAAPYHQFVSPLIGLQYNIGNSQMVCEVAVYSTRLYSLINRTQTNEIRNLHNEVDLMLEPFYLMDTYAINPKIDKGSVEFMIKYSNLKNIEQKPLFEPTISPQLLYADKLREYNNSLHLLSVHKLLHPLKSDNIVLDPNHGTDYLIVKWGDDSGSTIYSAAPNRYSFNQGFLVSFPHNVDSICWANSYEDSYEVFGKVSGLKYNAAIDTSYYTNLIPKPNTDRIQKDVMANYIFYKYKAGIEVDIPDEYVVDVESVLSVVDSNRIQASSANNCLEYPYGNSYRIGSNTSTIVAANAAAIEMSDAKFGEFPLYVFTNEGVFAMQSGGSNSLYSAVVPISYDKAINPNTLAVNYNVLFVTERGVMSLNNQGVSLISEGLNKQDNTIPEWMRTTEMLHAPQHNEVFATDKENKLLYVFSLDNKVWSTRDIEEGRILNNGELVTEGKIINLLHETDVDELTEVAISTRPIKLGSMELKRLDTFILRFESASDQIISIQISGSTDTTNWIRFREVSVYTNRDIIIRRVPMSAKYIRINITGSVTDDIKILAMEMEYYLRMLRRMR